MQTMLSRVYGWANHLEQQSLLLTVTLTLPYLTYPKCPTDPTHANNL